jgi:hypothetical protein
MLSEQLELGIARLHVPLNDMILGHKRLPLSQGGRAAKFGGLAIEEVAFRIEVVVK